MFSFILFRFQQGELIAGYNDMKTALNEYLRQFAEQGKVVKAEDIRNFFEAMEAKKKAKGNPQYYCGWVGGSITFRDAFLRQSFLSRIGVDWHSADRDLEI